jgi:hypothetical protein
MVFAFKGQYPFGEFPCKRQRFVSGFALVELNGVLPCKRMATDNFHSENRGSTGAFQQLCGFSERDTG